MGRKKLIDEKVGLDVKKPKKKKGCCFKCCISTLIITIVLLGAGIGVGWYFGDKLLVSRYNTSVKEVFSVYKNFKNFKDVEKHEINNAYTDAHADEFISDLTDAILLKNVSVAEFKDAMMDLASSFLSGEEADYSSLTDLFKEENINVEKLRDYEDSKIEEYYLKVEDKKLASFLNNVILKSALEGIDLNKYASDYEQFLDLKKVNIKDKVAISQITFYKDENGQAHMSLILKIELKNTINMAADSVDVKKMLGGSVNGTVETLIKPAVFLGKGLINLILPKKLYISADIHLTDSTQSQVALNKMGQNDIEIIDKFTNNAVSNQLDSIFSADGAIMGILNKINETVPVNNSISNGAIKVDAIQLGLDYAVNNQLEEGKERATSAHIYSLLAMDAEKDLEERSVPDYFQYTYQIINGEYELENGMPKLIDVEQKRDITMLDEINKEYEDALLFAFSKYYGLDLEKVDSLKTIFDLMQGDVDLSTLFDGDKITEIIEGDAQGLVLNDQMVAALVGASLSNFIDSEDMDLSAIVPRYTSLSLETDEDSGEEHNILEIGIQVLISQLLEEMLSGEDFAGYKGIITSILPKSILISATIDISINKPEEFEFKETYITLGSYSKQKSDQIINTLNALMSLGGEGGLSFDDVLDQLVAVKDAIQTIADTIPISLGQSEFIVPDVFETIAAVLGKEMDVTVTGEELRNNLQFITQLNAETGFEAGGAANKFKENYALYDDKELTDIMDSIKNSISGEGSSTSFIDLIDEEKVKDMAKTDANELEIDAHMFAELLLNAIENDETASEYVNEETLKYLVLSQEIMADGKLHDFAQFTISLSVEKFLEETDNSMTGLLSSIVKNDIFLTIKIDITLGELGVDFDEKYSTFYINGDEGKTDDLTDFLRKLDVDVHEAADSVIRDFETEIAKLLQNINDSKVATIELNGNRFIMSDLFTVMSNVITDSLSNDERIERDEVKDMINYLLNEGNPEIQKEVDFKNYYYTNEEKTAYAHESDIAAFQGTSLTADDYEKVDFSDELFKNLKASYALADEDEDGNEFSLNDLLGMLGVGSSDSDGTSETLQISEVVDADKFKQLVFSADVDMDISKLLFSGLILNQWGTFIGDNEITEENFIYSNIIIGEDGIFGKTDHKYIVVAIQLELTSFLDDDIFNKFLGNTTTVIAVAIDVTPDLPDGEENDEIMFNINEIGNEKTDGVYATINKLGLTFDFTAMEEGAKKVFAEIKDTIGLHFEEKNSEDMLVLPNVFDLVNKLVYEKKDNSTLTGGAIKEVLQGIHYKETNGMSEFYSEKIFNPIHEDDFELDELMKGKIDSTITEGMLSNILSTPINVEIGLEDNYIGKLTADQADSGGSSFNGTIASLSILSKDNPFTDGSNAQKEMERLDNYDETITVGTSDFISIVFEMDLTDLVAGGEEMESIASKIIPEKFYVTMLIEYDSTGGFSLYNGYFIINHMNKSQQSNLFEMFGVDYNQISDNMTENFNACSSRLSGALNQITNAVSQSLPSVGITITVSDGYFTTSSEVNSIGQYAYRITSETPSTPSIP